MDLYTLTDTFLAKESIDEFVSAIWTERYSASGDFQLVLAATERNIEILKEGTYLALRGSNEVMEVQTQQIEDNLLTLNGQTLVEFLNQRFLWSPNPESSAVYERIRDYVDTTRKPGEFISHIVDKWAINPVAFAGGWAPANLTWGNEEIQFLTLGDIDTSGTVQRLTGTVGPLYDAVAALAEQYGVGISLYLESADPDTGYSLKFKTYKGVDRTSDQSVVPLVRLVPGIDDISDIKEIRSNAKFKNVVYVYYQGIITEHLLDPEAPAPESLERRVLIVDAEGAPTATGKYVTDWRWGNYGQVYVTPEDIAAFREQNARDAFANHNYIRTIDGQTSPITEYKYGTHYGLGDLIELEGLTGAISKARITEYIRSQDKTGERSYPTITVVT